MSKYIKFSQPFIGRQEIKSTINTLKSGWLTTGKKTKIFEDKFKKFKGSKYAIALNSCTAAIHLSLLALGLKKGDEVITTALTFCSTINSIIYTGATPVLVDVDPVTQNIDHNKIEKKITKKTKALLVVHFAGRPCEMNKISKIAKKYNLKLIEDCAHAIETQYNSKNTGTFGDFGCFSFYATKNLVTGEGGMIITNNKKFYQKIKVLSLHGMDKAAWNRYGKQGYRHYDVTQIGYKYNMSDIQSSIGIEQLKKLNIHHKIRENIWNKYEKSFKNLSFGKPKSFNQKKIKHSYHLYNLFINKQRDGLSRDQAISQLHKKKIGVGIHYRAIPEHSIYKKIFGWKLKDYPNSKRIGRETISIPLSPALKEKEVDTIIKSIKKIFFK